MSEARWPGGAHGALSLSFDNLGEAAELEAGATPAEPGRHFTATRALPEILDRLEARKLHATFFLEGLNTELYPDLLRAVAARGHEIGYHAWRHEQWDGLTPATQAENLARGLAAFANLDVEVTGMRPPGGVLGEGGLDVLRSAGLRYCSPAGIGVGEDDGIAVLPFQWRHVDAACTLPPLTHARKQMTGSADPVEPAAFLDSLAAEIDRLAENGGYMAIVLHPVLLDWLGHLNLEALLDRVAACKPGEIWVARCEAVAEHVLAHPGEPRVSMSLDTSSWAHDG